MAEFRPLRYSYDVSTPTGITTFGGDDTLPIEILPFGINNKAYDLGYIALASANINSGVLIKANSNTWILSENANTPGLFLNSALSWDNPPGSVITYEMQDGNYTIKFHSDDANSIANTYVTNNVYYNANTQTLYTPAIQTDTANITGSIIINGDLTVNGNTTTKSAFIEIRSGSNLYPDDAGFRINLTTDANGVVTSSRSLKWDNSNTRFRLTNDGTNYSNIAVASDKLSSFAETTSSELASVISDETGTGSLVFSNNAVLVTPTIGVATATSVNKVSITAPTTSATLTLANGSSLITSGAFSTTLTATGSTNVTLPTSGTLATTAAATTSSAGLVQLNDTINTANSSLAATANSVKTAYDAGIQILSGLFSNSYTIDFTNTNGTKIKTGYNNFLPFINSYGNINNLPLNAHGKVTFNSTTQNKSFDLGVNNNNVQLLDSISSNSTIYGATANSVKTAYDLASTSNTNAANASFLTVGTLSNARLSNVPNSALANSNITVNAGNGLSGGGILPLGGSISLSANNATTSSAGIVQLNDTVSSTSATQAATANSVKTAYDLANTKLNIAGGTITGNLTISGDLFVSGNTVTLDVGTLLVEDNIIELRKGVSLPATDGGIQVNLTTNASGVVTSSRSLKWVNASNRFQLTNDGTNYSNIIVASDIATTSNIGIVQLNDTINSTSTTQAGTANSVKSAYDLANTANINAANASYLNIGIVNATRLGIGIPNANNFLRGDGSWQSVYSTLNFIGDATGTGTTGSNTTLILANTGVIAGRYGGENKIPSFNVDSKGRIFDVTESVIDTSSISNIQLNDTINTANSSLAATANSVKSVYDAGIQILSGLFSNSYTIDFTNTNGTKIKTGYNNFLPFINSYGNINNLPLNAHGKVTFNSTTQNKSFELSVNNNNVQLLDSISSNSTIYGATANSVKTAYDLANTSNTNAANASFLTVGTLSNARLPAFIGDVTSTVGTSLLTLANSGVTSGSYGSASSIPTYTVDAKGRLTAASNTAIAIASSAVSGLAASATTDTSNATNIISGTLSNARLSNIPNSALANSSISINGTIVALGGSIDGLTTSAATTSAAGLVQLNNFINSTSITEAATANSVKTAYDAGIQILSGLFSNSYTIDFTNTNGTKIKTGYNNFLPFINSYGNINNLPLNAHGKVTFNSTTQNKSFDLGVNNNNVQLLDSISSNSTIYGATANSVKTAYDLANTKLNSAGGTISGDLIIQNGFNLNANNIKLNTSNIYSSNTIISQNNSTIVVDTFTSTMFRSAQYFIQISKTGATKDFNITNIMIFHDDTDVYLTEYGSLNKGYYIGNIDANIINNNVSLEFSDYGDASVNNIQIKFIRIAINN